MKFGLHLPQLGRAASPERIASIAILAEELGFDDVWVSDHVAVPTSFEGIPSFFPEPVPLLSAAAAHTQRVGLGTSVIVPAYRNPMHFAKQWATLDWLAPGRTILGIGAGWLAEEFAALGVPFEERGRRLDDYIDGWRALWAGATDFESRFFTFEGVRVNPRPANGIPIWIGGSSMGALRRAARCDGWHGTWAPLEEFTRRTDALAVATEQIGRDRSEVTVSVHMEVTLGDGLDYSGWSSVGDGYGDRRPVTGGPNEVAELLQTYAAAGLDHVLATPVIRGKALWDAMVPALAEVHQLLNSGAS